MKEDVAADVSLAEDLDRPFLDLQRAAQFLRPPQEEVVDPVGVGLGQAAGAGERCHEPQQVEAILSVKVPGPGGDLRPKSGALLGLDQAQPEVVEGRRQRGRRPAQAPGPARSCSRLLHSLSSAKA